MPQATEGSVLTRRPKGAVLSREAVFGGEAGGRGAGAYAKLVVDGVEVAVYGVGAYEKLAGYPGVGEALGYELEDVYFSGTEAGRVVRGY